MINILLLRVQDFSFGPSDIAPVPYIILALDQNSINIIFIISLSLFIILSLLSFNYSLLYLKIIYLLTDHIIYCNIIYIYTVTTIPFIYFIPVTRFNSFLLHQTIQQQFRNSHSKSTSLWLNLFFDYNCSFSK